MDSLETLIKGTPDWHNIVNDNFNKIKSSMRTGTTVVIATAKSRNKEQADYVIPDGTTGAQDIIWDFINDLDKGGKVLLLEGTYIFDSDLIFRDDNVTLEGVGYGTIIKAHDGFYSPFAMISNGNNTTERVAIRNLMLDSNNVTGGISFYNTSDSIIENVIVLNAKEAIKIGGSDRFVIRNNILVAGEPEEGLSRGIYAMSGNENISILDNLIQGFNHGMYLWNGALIKGNRFLNNSIYGISGVRLENTLIEGNLFIQNGYDADTSDACQLLIRMESSYNMIQGNIFRKGDESLGPVSRFGVRVDSNCIGNMITNNDLYDAASSSKITDGGTGTILNPGNRGV